MVLDAGLEGDAAQRGHDRDAPTPQLVGAQRGFPSGSCREARRVERVVARADVEVAGRVAHRTGEATEHDRARTEIGVGTARDPTVGALHPEQAGVAGGNADRAAPVAPGRDRNE